MSQAGKGVLLGLIIEKNIETLRTEGHLNACEECAERMRKRENVRRAIRGTITSQHTGKYQYEYAKPRYESTGDSMPYRCGNMGKRLLDTDRKPSSDYDVISGHKVASSGTKLYWEHWIDFTSMEPTVENNL